MAETLRGLLATTSVVTVEERRAIVDQAIALLEGVYVHRPQKEARHAINPIQRLRLLRDRLDRDKDALHSTDISFHRDMAAIFTSLRDLHTSYLLPEPYSRYLAYIPFLLESCLDRGKEKFLVTRLVGDVAVPGFTPGAEVRHWNGIPIRRAIELNGELQAGNNSSARFAQGLHALTMRPLARSLPPDEDWVVITYKPVKGPVREARFPWQVTQTAETPRSSGELSGVARYANTSSGIDLQAALIHAARRTFFSRSARPSAIDTQLQNVFRAYPVAQGRYGYLRIFSFDVVSADGFLDECQRLLQQLPQDGLILDVRGNPGGSILAAERLLQLFTPRPIEPQPFQFLNTPQVKQLCVHYRESPQPGLTLGPWRQSVEEALQTGASHSNGVPITPEHEANSAGQQYYGPVVLITDPLCYSACDMFAAGFQDHRIGPVIGVEGATGAGGANVWQHGLLASLIKPGDGWPFTPLQSGVGMTVAIRRSLRVGAHAGMLLEEFGVSPDLEYPMSRRDLLGGNKDLIEKAIAKLEEVAKTSPPRTLRIAGIQTSPGRIGFELTTRNLARVDLWVDNRPLESWNVKDGSRRVEADLRRATPRWLRALGFTAENSLEPVASARARI